MGGVGSGRKPREYPPAIVRLACDLYLGGLTVMEIRSVFPRGYRVQTILERHLPERRVAAKREQDGPKNHMWKGDQAGYQALHLRVQQERGRPSLCERCGTTEGRFEWSNLSGHYADTADYWRLCVPCHRKFDAARRRAAA